MYHVRSCKGAADSGCCSWLLFRPPKIDTAYTCVHLVSSAVLPPTRRDASADDGSSVATVAPAQPGLGDEDATAVAEAGEDAEAERGDGRVIEVVENR